MGVCPESTRTAIRQNLGHTQAFASQELSAPWRGEINVKIGQLGASIDPGAACK